MTQLETILSEFPELSDKQRAQITQLDELYRHWNAIINVISRKDIDNLYSHHVLHSLLIAKIKQFETGSVIMDIGCGGGFPGIPLAIMFPETQFIMVDSIAKKIRVVEGVTASLRLSNVQCFNARAESLKIKCDYVVSRAVTDLKEFMGWSWPMLKGGSGKGIYYLKGGDLTAEIAAAKEKFPAASKTKLYDLSTLTPDPFFETKKLLFIEK